MTKLGARRSVLGLDESTDSFHRGAVPQAVFANAILSISDDLEFRNKFLEICDQFDQHLVSQSIVDSIVKDFGTTPRAWEIRAGFLLEQEEEAPAVKKAKAPQGDSELTRQEQRALRVYEEAVDALPSNADMWAAFASFLRDRRALASPSSGKASHLAALIHQTYSRAAAAKAMTTSMFIDWSLFSSNTSSAEDILRQGLVVHPSSPDLWQQLLNTQVVYQSS